MVAAGIEARPSQFRLKVQAKGAAHGLDTAVGARTVVLASDTLTSRIAALQRGQSRVPQLRQKLQVAGQSATTPARRVWEQDETFCVQHLRQEIQISVRNEKPRNRSPEEGRAHRGRWLHRGGLRHFYLEE